ncbi:PAS domain-containing sensor histidine kinase [Pseudomonas sp. HR96]|uniref:PAS domain-containing sensor histidine kinase n=1 Tax=Pseudomonas sp. HR96 TaxID=1027966 RepID=UPI002A74F740|nr:PAS domain-containing sensor histidine kinase [Pseudomonas sp. HR96]WPP02275.1 PAS domain-containing sensor histidine kinase [Pseudomonas sp. HR96]
MPMRIEPLPALDADLLWQQAACGLLVTDDAGVITRANSTFARWLGYDQEQLLGRPLHTLLTMAGRIFHQTHWAPLLHVQGSISEVKLELLHSAGQRIPMMLNAIRRQHHGVMIQELSLFVAEDRHRYERELINARLLAEERLEHQLMIEQVLNETQQELREAHAQAERRAELAERMVGIVSHDLRNPLSAIRMAADLLQRNETDERQALERHARMVSHIGNSVDRAQRLITDLLDFTLIQVGRGLPVTLAPLDLHELVANTVEELRLTFPGRELHHERHGAGGFLGDADRLYQLLGNLVANAMAYGDSNGTVTVSTRFDPHSVILSVHNVGEPLPEQAQVHLFEPMTRGHQDDGRHNLGLGLFIVREIARAHQGDVAVISTADMGTTFVVRCPRSPEHGG